jgi:hypothetical protein
MGEEFKEVGFNAIKKDLEKEGIRLIPTSKLKYFNPIAAHITKELGKNYIVLTLASAEKNGLKKNGIETIIYPKDPKAYKVLKGPRSVSLDEHFVTIVRSPKDKTLYIRVTSRMGEKGYAPEIVKKVKKIVEDVLRSRGVSYTKDEESFFVKFKHDLAAKERPEDYGNYNTNAMVRKTLEKLPKYEYTEFKTGRLRDLRIKYHR